MISANWQFSALRRVATGFSIKESFRQSALTFSHKLTSRDVKKPATMVSVPNDRVEKELMSESYILALDQGTTSSRALLVDQAGKVVASANREFTQYYPQPAWVEHDAEEIWQTQISVAEEALSAAQATPKDVAAIGITNQRETVLIWDRETSRPLHRAIVWQCRRTAPDCDRIRQEGFDRVLRERTGLVADAYFSATKIAWLLEHIPQARKRAERGEICCGTIDSWLIWKLTGGRVHVTDASNASRTLLFNLRTLDWDDEILHYFRIPR